MLKRPGQQAKLSHGGNEWTGGLRRGASCRVQDCWASSNMEEWRERAESRL